MQWIKGVWTRTGVCVIAVAVLIVAASCSKKEPSSTAGPAPSAAPAQSQAPAQAQPESQVKQCLPLPLAIWRPCRSSYPSPCSWGLRRVSTG